MEPSTLTGSGNQGRRISKRKTTVPARIYETAAGRGHATRPPHQGDGEGRFNHLSCNGLNATITISIIAVQALVIAILLKNSSSAQQSTEPLIPYTKLANQTRTVAECTIQASAGCVKQGLNLGPLSTAKECAVAVSKHKGKCGNTFMFSSTNLNWGCRCCVVDDAPRYYQHPKWALHSISNCCVNKTRDCLDKEVYLLKRGMSHLQKENDKLRDQSMYKTVTEERVSEIYGALREVVETLRKEQSKLKDPWFAFAGTLLGVLRTRPSGMMRWDDDIDLAVKASSINDVHDILKRNPRLIWKPHGQFLAYKYGLANTTMAIDFFGLGKNGSKWHLVTPNGKEIERHLGPTYYMYKEEMKSVTPCRCWDLDLQCPSGGLTFLKRLYGKNALTKASVHNHKGDKYRDIDMEKEDLNQYAAYFPAMNRDLLNKLYFRDSVEGDSGSEGNNLSNES